MSLVRTIPGFLSLFLSNLTILLEQYSMLCTIRGDMSSVGLSTYIDPKTQRTSYAFDYNIVLCFADNELSAFFEWRDEEVKLYWILRSLFNQ